MITTPTPTPALFDHWNPSQQEPPRRPNPVAGVHPGVQLLVRHWLTSALDDAHWELAGLVPLSSAALEPPERHGPPPFAPALLRRLALDALRRLLRAEARLAIEVLEILVLSRKAQPRVQVMFSDHCTRIEQVYLELQRRVGAGAALPMLVWELRLLRHRASEAAARLAWGH